MNWIKIHNDQSKSIATPAIHILKISSYIDIRMSLQNQISRLFLLGPANIQHQVYSDINHSLKPNMKLFRKVWHKISNGHYIYLIIYKENVVMAYSFVFKYSTFSAYTLISFRAYHSASVIVKYVFRH